MSSGPHGGPLLDLAGGRVEVSVFETGVPPRFRLYFSDGAGKPWLPEPQAVTVETVRPGNTRQRFEFRAGADGGFLESTTDIPEPHEFDLTLTLRRGDEAQTAETRFSEEAHGHDHGAHGHTHGMVNPLIATTERGLWAVKWSFVALLVTATLQVIVVVLSHSVALLADVIHNFGDAATAIPLGIAFLLARRPASPRFTYGFGRVEDLAGLTVVLMILASAAVACYTAIDRLLHPQAITSLGAVVVASIIGFVGNEGVAIFRIKVGKEIGSAALIADGYHARTDGWTSLAVLAGAAGVYLGYPTADPIVGLAIAVAILWIVWKSAAAVLVRILDGVEPEVLDQVRATATQVAGVVAVTNLRARWVGHRLRAEVNLAVAPDTTVAESHRIATAVEHQLQHKLKFLAGAIIHVDPSDVSGEDEHRIAEHAHDGLATHGH